MNDQIIRNTLMSIEKELRALVKIQITVLVERKAKDGDFNILDDNEKPVFKKPQSVDAMDKYEESLYKKIYNKAGQNKESDI